MNDYALSALLGVVEGVTEFLPVSSTAHLRIAEKLLGLSLEDGFWKVYSVVIQLGAILCLPVYFRARLIGFIKQPRPVFLTAAAFVATAIPAFLLLKVIGHNLESLTVMACALIGGGVVMALVDRFAVGARTVEEMTYGQAGLIGLAQVLAAVFPGLSRSMATIAGGQALGFSRAAALEFSFFLSMPTMAAATFLALLKLPHDPLSGGQWGVLGVGFAVSFAVAYASVAFLMRWVQRHGFLPFAVYRVLAGFAILGLMV